MSIPEDDTCTSIETQGPKSTLELQVCMRVCHYNNLLHVLRITRTDGGMTTTRGYVYVQK